MLLGNERSCLNAIKGGRRSLLMPPARAEQADMAMTALVPLVVLHCSPVEHWDDAEV